MLLGLVSAKGSPGVTTTALALAACAGSDALVVELDPSGGSLEGWTGTTGEPGLVRVASGLRRALDDSSVLQGVVEAPPGVASVLAPVSGTMAESSIATMGERLTIAMSSTSRTVVIDGGRWSRSQATARRVAGCDRIAVVCQPAVASIAAAAALVEQLRGFVTGGVALLLVGERPYGPSEVAQATGISVIGALPWDARAVNGLMVGGANKAWARSSLARSARALVASLSAQSTDLAEVAS